MPADKSRIARRLEEEAQYRPTSADPPFPRTVLVEISNVCNHRCVFCAYPKMTRPGRRIDLDLLRRLLREAHALGAREAGFYSGAEPFTSPDLEEVVRFTKSLGYEYAFISTNGSLATEPRMKALIDNGLDSVKFSINATDRETYRQVHGQDHFDRVIHHVKFASGYRTEIGSPLYISVSFVAVDGRVVADPATRRSLEALLADDVDEIIFWEAASGNGQMIGLGRSGISAPCTLPFNRAHISAEGYLRMCCNDYQNYLSLVDLNHVSLKDAWSAGVFRDMRQRHLDDRLQGTLCYNCIYDVNTPIEPVVAELAVKVPPDFFLFKRPE